MNTNVFNRLGALPRPGTQLEIESLRFTVRRTSRKRIEEVLIEQIGEDAGL